MKKILFIITFLFLTVSLFSQCRIGTKWQAVKDEFSDYTYDLKTAYTDEGERTITINMTSAIVRYIFTSSDICYVTIILPKTQAKVNGYVEMYNSKYTIISSTKWKAYISGMVADIRLYSLDDGTMYFVWTESE